MAVNLTKIGGLVKVEPTGTNTFYINPVTSYIRFYLNETSDAVAIVLGETKIEAEDFTDISVAGEACTDQEDFETKIATVFPSAGAAAIPTLAQVLEAGNDADGLEILNVTQIEVIERITIGQQENSNGVLAIKNTLGNEAIIKATNLLDSRNIEMPDDSGTIELAP